MKRAKTYRVRVRLIDLHSRKKPLDKARERNSVERKYHENSSSSATNPLPDDGEANVDDSRERGIY